MATASTPPALHDLFRVQPPQQDRATPEPPRPPRSYTRSRTLRAQFALALCLGLPLGTAAAQGCTQCRDNVQATPPRTQHAYRDAILLLGGTALTVCSAAVIALRRLR